MRTHVAKHILDNKTVEGACGFCGLTCDSFLEIRESSGAGNKMNFKPHSNIALMFIILIWVQLRKHLSIRLAVIVLFFVVFVDKLTGQKIDELLLSS
jgi:hypothetical protein